MRLHERGAIHSIFVLQNVGQEFIKLSESETKRRLEIAPDEISVMFKSKIPHVFPKFAFDPPVDQRRVWSLRHRGPFA